MKKIIFIHTIRQFERSHLVVNDIKSQNQIQIVAINIDLRLFLRNKEIPYSIPEEFIDEDQARELDRLTFKMSYNWHNNLFKYKDISLGRLGAWEKIYYFSRIIRNVQMLPCITHGPGACLCA